MYYRYHKYETSCLWCMKRKTFKLFGLYSQESPQSPFICRLLGRPAALNKFLVTKRSSATAGLGTGKLTLANY